MKRIFTCFLLVAGLCSHVFSGVVCAPDSSFTEFGFYPDSSGFAEGCEDSFYTESFTVVADDSFQLDSGPVVTVDSIVVTGVNNIPLGLFVNCNPFSCMYPGGSLGCIEFTGTPTEPGSYGITVNVTIYYNDTSVDTVFAVGTILINARDCAGVCGGTASIDSCGVCSGGTTGILPDCADDNACTVDACDSLGCIYTQLNCDDSNACTLDACDSLTGCFYTVVDCNDSNACTMDVCDSLLGCTFTQIACNDSNACTIDACDSITGCFFTVIECNDSNACTIDACDSLLGCFFTQAVCDDSNACTLDACDSLTGCFFTAIDCDDNDACTTDACDSLLGCFYTTVDCNDSSVCTIDACDSLLGCVNTPVVCDDTNACTIDVCDSLLGCTFTTIDCDDNSVCTTEVCDTTTGCVYTPVDCSDGDACSVDLCDSLTGCFNSPNCDDNNVCTSDVCDSLLGCIFTLIECNDSNACTIDACDTVTGCTFTPVDCNDNNACTDEACDSTLGCVYTVVVCDDSNACTIDVCDSLLGCTTTAIVCDDSNACTIDACDSLLGCTFTLIACDDSNACTIDVCDSLLGCTFTLIACDDSNACTIDACDSLLGCAFTLIACDDSNACTIDVCDSLLGCTTTTIVCDDSNACTIDACDSLLGCIFTPVNCDDSDACTIDGCNTLTGCVNTPIDCSDGDPCTTDSCSGGICSNVSSGFAVTATGVNPSLCDNCDGSAAAAVSGGTPPYQYLWSTGDTTSTIGDSTLTSTGTRKCINSGGAQFIASTGDTFLVDQNFSGTTFTYVNNTVSDIAGTTDDALYRTERNTTDSMIYAIPVVNGAYTVQLHFAELFFGVAGGQPNPVGGAAGKRVFDVAIEGIVVLNDYDVVADVGPATATVKTFATNVTDGALTIKFTSIVNRAKVNGICVEPQSISAPNGLCAGDYSVTVTDANGCTAMDTVTLVNLVCTDGDPCTVDSCDNGACLFVPVVCDDGDACTTDSCSGGLCVFTPVICSDSDTCTLDSCVNGVCVFSPNPNCDVCDSNSVTVTISDAGGAFCQGVVQLTAMASDTAVAYAWSTGDTTMSIDAMPNAIYSVTVTTTNGCTATDTLGTGDTDDLLSSYVIVAMKEVILERNTVFSGGVGVNGNHNKAQIEEGSIITAPGTFVKADVINPKDGSMITTQIPDQAGITLPAFEFNNQCDSGERLNIPDRANVTLHAPVYNAIFIGRNSSVTFTAGDLNIKNIHTQENVTISFAAECATVRVCDKVQLGADNTWNPDSADVKLFVEKDVTIGGGSIVISDIYMNGGNMKIKNGTSSDPNIMIGLFLVNRVKADDYTYWYQNTVCEDCSDAPVLCAGNERKVSSFTLVNADTDDDIGTLQDGDVIDLSATGNVSIRANVCNDSNVESVRFLLNGSNYKMENIAFYSIAGDNNGNYDPWMIAPGTYTITAIPYSGDNGTGMVGTALTITITVTGSAKMGDSETPQMVQPAEDGVLLTAYPNPFADRLNVEFTLPADSKVMLEVFNMEGKRIEVLFEGNVIAGQLNKAVFDSGTTPGGMVIYRLQTASGTYYNKAILSR